MSDRACPIGDCTGTVAFEAEVVEVTPRYQLHDLTEVDEFVECPSCEAEVAGFYDEDGEDGDGDATTADGDRDAGDADGDGVELILDIDDDGADSAREAEADASADGADSTLADDGFDDPDAVLEDVDVDDEDDEDGDDDNESVFG